MTGEANWIPIAMVLVGGLAILAFAASSSLWFRYLRREQRRLVCPASGKPVLCEVVKDTRTGEWTGVLRCSAHRNPDDVRCSMKCLANLDGTTDARYQLEMHEPQ